MIAGQENLRDRESFENRGPCVMRIFQKTLFVALLDRCLLVADHPGKEPRHRFNHNGRGEFSSRQDIIADGNLPIDAEGNRPFVDPFVPAADKEDRAFFGHIARHLLVEEGPAWREENYFFDLMFLSKGANRIDDDRGLQDHPGTPSVRAVIDTVMFVGREVAEGMAKYFYDSLFRRIPQNSDGKIGLKGLGEEGEDVKIHDRIDMV